MTVLQQLQNHLKTPIQLLGGELEHKPHAPRIHCQDGLSLSVQASELHYSKPQSNYGPWTHVEIQTNDPVIEFEPYQGKDNICAYVPISTVARVLIKHGGFKTRHRG